MKHSLMILLCAGLASAQTASDPAAAVLRRASKVSETKAIEGLRHDASTDPAAAEIFSSLRDTGARAELAARLEKSDADGSLRAELEALAKAMPNLDRAHKTADSIDEKGLSGEDASGARPGGPVDEPEGFSGNTDVYAGAIRAGRQGGPTLEAHGQASYKKGPWEGELEASGLIAPYGGRVPGVYNLGVGVQRKIDDTSNFVFVEGEAERDELLGVSFSRSIRAGVGRDVIDSARQALTLAVSVGPNVEGTFAGTDHFISPAMSADYTLHLNPAWSVVQKLEAEFNAKDTKDIELSSVTSVVWKLSEKLSAQITHSYKGRTEDVPGYAKSRSSNLIGLHYDF
jgi:hypothetical protein